MLCTRSHSDDSRFVFLDRQSGQLRTDPIYAAGFLDWCYDTRPGMLLTRLLLSRVFVSAAYGWYYRQRWTHRTIEPFARTMSVDLSDISDPLESFRSFSEFISRRIDLAKRPIDPDPNRCVSPVDGRLFAYPRLDNGKALRIKGGLFDRARLLANHELATRYNGGAVVIMRLYLADYHHFHFPDSGIPHESHPVPGRYFAVSPYSRKWAVPFYGENHRVITLFDSAHFGSIAIVEVGAFTVGSVRQCFSPGVRVSKGQHKGFFELGGSIVVLLFEPDAILLDDDLCNNSDAGFETFVRMGEGIGRSPSSIVVMPKA
jgi:phosphatidylserine decarboxylase